MLIFDYLYEHVPNCIPFPEEKGKCQIASLSVYSNSKFDINIILAFNSVKQYNMKRLLIYMLVYKKKSKKQICDNMHNPLYDKYLITIN